MCGSEGTPFLGLLVLNSRLPGKVYHPALASSENTKFGNIQNTRGVVHGKVVFAVATNYVGLIVFDSRLQAKSIINKVLSSIASPANATFGNNIWNTQAVRHGKLILIYIHGGCRPALWYTEPYAIFFREERKGEKDVKNLYSCSLNLKCKGSILHCYFGSYCQAQVIQ